MGCCPDRQVAGLACLPQNVLGPKEEHVGSGAVEEHTSQSEPLNPFNKAMEQPLMSGHVLRILRVAARYILLAAGMAELYLHQIQKDSSQKLVRSTQAGDGPGRSASPFWNPPKRGDASKKPTRDPNMVVGAAYSHADMLKFDSFSSSRPKTPPSSQSAKARTSDVSSSSRPTPGLSSPPFRTYMNFLSNTNDDWKADEEDEMMDPANALHLINHPPTAANATPKEIDAANSRITRINKFKKILQASTIPIAELRQLAWSGVPEEVRAMTWQLLLSYLPANSERRVATLERKRKEYLDGVRQAFERGGANPSTAGKARGLDEAIWHQISIDVPRTNPHIELYSYEATQRSLERILYLWAVRHPASGYVQGINDLVSPFWQVFLGIYIGDPNVESGMDPGQLPKPVLDAVEADSFWCLTKLLDGIQDHYIVAQPGIQRQVAALRDLTARIDGSLVKHLEKENVEFIQFSFRWMNCLLMREISVKNTIRMWDTYLAEEQGFSEFHLYVCAAFLVKWSDKLVKMDFQEIMMFLQSLPTKSWTEKDIELLLSEAFIWQSLFKGSSAHLRGQTSRAPSTSLQL
ncbi:GTPase-activating protein gyp1 [Verticillium alfalfae VaMs.102]|uniref:GTPase-activating protein gyp1 n=1 Tax=Verticillium alfalfae (strain VaMs.102 / ATCC MYA-4576 / FGSC 10136) TaxID=526221 RepID=C9S698_VERA1|nr:GTPase-activating protein gyp1 [Verticillium alfalfae VaMs.102]EEY14410.1 GTPase-activating protein gyp1 [Verticillium alfalfae VaMs.102]